MTQLSLIICTYNRAQFLHDLLTSVEREVTPSLDLEVIVVDNNSTDTTRDVCDAFSQRIPSLIYVFEPNQGLSFARNAGAARASKDYILYIDDDAVLSEAFLERVEVILRRFQPDFFGGPVIPRFDRPPPAWFDPASEIRQFERFSGFSAKASVSGGNLGVRRSVMQRLGPFDTDLGMKGGSLGLGEDREFVERYRKMTPPENQRLYYAVEIPILHYTMPSKFDKKYQFARKFLGSIAQERTFVLYGKRSAIKSLVLTTVLLAIFPLRALRLLWGNRFNETGRFKVLRDFLALAGRLIGGLSAGLRQVVSLWRPGAAIEGETTERQVPTGTPSA